MASQYELTYAKEPRSSTRVRFAIYHTHVLTHFCGVRRVPHKVVGVSQYPIDHGCDHHPKQHDCPSGIFVIVVHQEYDRCNDVDQLSKLTPDA